MTLASYSFFCCILTSVIESPNVWKAPPDDTAYLSMCSSMFSTLI